MSIDPILVVGEICVDFTLGTAVTPVKMRLGGIVHAARGLWACGISYAVAAICPEYLVAEAEAYLKTHGCSEFILLGNVVGAPNVFVIGDVREVGHQGYENLLRDAKEIRFFDVLHQLKEYLKVVIFPGAFNIEETSFYLSDQAKVTIDIAYDIACLSDLKAFAGRLFAVAISTSSELFLSIAEREVGPLIQACRDIGARQLLLKENRGGSRLFDLESGEIREIPAVLGITVNSVGVGDAYTAVFAAIGDPEEAVWRGMQVATRYSQTTFPDNLRRDVERELRLTIEEVRGLGGVILPWHERREFEIYLAAPDFSYVDKPEVDAAVSALKYHNFVVRRPVLENGEADKNSEHSLLKQFYQSDVELLKRCAIVFAVPLLRDPGTLVEVGMAIALNKPVVTFDPRRENNNTMVICGSSVYSLDLDECLTGVFEAISAIRRKRP